MRQIQFPVFTVVVFKGSPTSSHLTESYRLTFETLADAERCARDTVSIRRLGAADNRPYTPPCASVHEDSPSLGLGKMVAEHVSRARRKYIQAIARGERLP